MMSDWRGFIRSDMGRRVSVFLVVALVLATITPLALRTRAADFTEAYIRLARMKASTATDVTVVMKPATAGTEAKITVLFGTGTTVCAGATTVNTTSLPTGVTAVPGTLSASGSGQTVTVTGVTDMSVGTLYGLNIVGCITTGSAAQYTNTIKTLTSGDAEIDTKDVATRVITDDQITVNAIVPPTFSFTFGGNQMDFATDLDPAGIVSTNGILITIATNAANGWIAWVKSSNAALSSTVASHTIDSSGTVNGTPTTLSAGSEDYALDVNLTQDSGTAGTGTVTINAEYDGGASEGGTLTTGFSEIASADGPTDDDQITLVNKATISGLTPAASDYTDILTVVGAGHF